MLTDTKSNQPTGIARLLRGSDTAKAILFLVHDEIGSLAYPALLAAQLGPEVETYGLPPPGHGNSVHELAANMVAMIRKVQPRGPYWIAGCYLGAVVAYEITVQLLGENERIHFLALIDCSYSLFPAQPSLDCIKARLAANSDHGGETGELGGASAFAQAFAERATHYRPPAIRAPVFLLQSLGYGGEDMASTWSTLIPPDSAEIIPIHNRTGIAPGCDGASTGRALAGAVQKAMSRSGSRSVTDYDPLVRLQTGRATGRTLFCVPGAGATVVGFSSLIEGLGDEWQIHGLQPQGMDGLRVPHSSLAAGAASYLGSIQSVPFDRPIHLLGHSFGGWSVFEIAHRLCSLGRAIASVTIIDSTVPDRAPALCRPSSHRATLQQWIEIFEMHLDQPLGISAPHLDKLSLDEQLVVIHQRLLHWKLLPKNSNPHSLRGPFHAFAAALRTHFSPNYALHGPVNLILASDPRLDAVANQRAIESIAEGWRHFAPELKLLHAPGNHMTVLQRPHASVVAKWLNSAMNSSGGISIHKRRQ